MHQAWVVVLGVVPLVRGEWWGATTEGVKVLAAGGAWQDSEGGWGSGAWMGLVVGLAVLGAVILSALAVAVGVVVGSRVRPQPPARRIRTRPELVDPDTIVATPRPNEISRRSPSSLHNQV